ncbi:hypothetical protein HMPREF9318_01473 [Streptococcus urinalis FB127-CNA-2]|uniref:competence protein CoiA family protein n=1 Tax=Streptococcus urinalis TaxID=149016 RepID=UPI000225CDE2|nr:hypothetical protein HMPREF9318_01473 [Streptococcus urinalis FB127-CNA-2]VEF31528.1 Competence protein CoiA [Streptococcus urinalis]
MLTAKNQNGQLICILEQLDDSDTYFCPSCLGPLRIKAGTIMQKHFAHISR